MKKLNRIALISAVFLSLSSAAMAGDYDPSPEHPYGRPNPEAKAPLEDFSWAIGKWACEVEALNAEGGTNSWTNTWTWTYAFQGMAIEDWTTASNGRYYRVIRLWDPLKQAWQNTILGANFGLSIFTCRGRGSMVNFIWKMKR